MSSTSSVVASGFERDPRRLLLTGPMSGGQWVAVAITLLISATDGYDILAASLAAPGITTQWRLTHAVLGQVFAVNLIGLVLGATLVSPLADRIGHRPTIIGSLLLMTASMFLSAIAPRVLVLEASRLMVGVGIGGMVGATLSLATEYANLRNRPFTAAVFALGLPIGSLIVGAMATYLLKEQSWRSLFLSGGMVTAGSRRCRLVSCLSRSTT